MNNSEVLFPIKLEFHYPISKNLFFNTEIGVKIKGLRPGPTFKWREYGMYYYFEDRYYEAVGWRDLSKTYCDLLLGLGLYYKLPYGDLLRFNLGVNVSFKPIIEGYYRYYLTDS
jgi:hypothetical protein